MKYISTNKAPKAIGPYSQGIETDNLLFISGQIPINPENGEIIYNNFESAVETTLENILAITYEAGMTINNIVKITVYLKDISKFAKFNEIYGKFFDSHKPARVVVEVSNLPKNTDIEVDAICVGS